MTLFHAQVHRPFSDEQVTIADVLMISATAHKIARIVYHMLNPRQPYHDPGAQHYNELQRQRTLHHLQRQAKKLGLCLVPDVQPAVS